MKTTINELRSVIREELAGYMQQKVQGVIDDAVKSAEDYVDAVKDGKMFGKRGLLNALKEKIHTLNSLAKWLGMRREIEAIKCVDVLKSLDKLIEISSYAGDNYKDMVAHLNLAIKTAKDASYKNMPHVQNNQQLANIGSRKIA
jgi:hypothetical protein